MKFTYSWLKEYVDVKLKPQELAEKLTMAGLQIESLQQVDGDWVFEAEVTTNRPDWLGIFGIAREAAAITGGKIKNPQAASRQPQTTGQIANIQILDSRACSRYTGRIISGVKVSSSPDWLKIRLESIGLRPVNNIVDITNFVLFETGQPLHAFDLDKIVSGLAGLPVSRLKIVIRKAKKGEEIITIDGVKRTLDDKILIIASEFNDSTRKPANPLTRKPLAIAGIMGGKDTEVTPQTRNILLESAYFDPVTIRRASQSLGLVSDSSYRFERGVDYVVVKTASDRATGLILEVAGGKVGGFKDVGKRPKAAAKVSVRPKKVNGLLGLEILVKDITKILKSLGLGLENSSRGKMVFSIPSWRRDLKKETDLIEEIIRVYGYDRVPVVQPKDIDVQDRVFMPRRLEFQALVRDTLIGFGLDEVLTYSLVDKGLISVKNPLSPQLAALRSNLTQGVLSAAKWNLNRNINDIKLFEIGSVYSPQAIDSPEEDCLAICLSGSRSDNWQDGERKADFYYLKGIVEALFAKAGVSGYQIRLSPNDILSPQESADINIGTEHIGFLGRVKDELLNSMDIDKDCFVCEINLQRLLRHAKVDRRFSPLPKFPAVYRDISTLAEEKVSCGEMVSLIKEAGSELIKDVKLFDVYRGPQIPKGHKSLVYRLTYQSPDKTLTDKEVDAVHSRIIAALNEKLGVKTR